MTTDLFSFSNNPVSFQLCENNNIYNEVHSYARIVYTLSGSVHVQIRNQVFELLPDNLIYINPHEFHDISSDDAKYLLISLDYSYYDKSVIPTTPYIDCNSTTIKEGNDNNIKHLKNIIARFVQLSALSQTSDPIKAKSLSYELLSYLVTYFKIDNISTNRKEDKTTLIEDILKYCSENYATDISLASLSEEFHFTAPYMSKLFKQEVGTTFLSYMQDIRLRHVHSDLSRKNMTAEELAEKHGFPNVRSLQACFKEKYGVSLTEYKKNLNSKENQSSSLRNYGLSDDLNILSQNLNNFTNQTTDESKKNIVEIPSVHIGETTIPFKHPHCYQIGTGTAKELLDPINQEMLREAVKEIGFKYVSFHGILDDDMMIYSESENGTPIHSFWYVNRVIDFIISIGAKPIIELSFMPSKLAKDPEQKMFFKGSCTSIPKDYRKWDDLITDLFSDLILLFGKSEVESWPIQVWSIPDTSINEFGLGGIDGYIEMYSHTCTAIRKVIDNPLIELPKLIDETLENYNYMSELFTKMDKVYAPKAINVGYYAIARRNVPKDYAQTKRNLLLMDSASALDEEIEHIKENIEKCGKQNLQFRISEWNSSLSHRNLVNDTAYKATYIVRNVIENHEKVDGFGYWTLFDTTETQPPKQAFHGGLGLFTRDGLKKSAYYGFWILSHLGDEMITRGDGYAIFKKDNKIQVLLYNYHHINNLYSQGEMFDMSFTNRYSAFTQATDVKYLLTLTGLENGDYQIENTIIDKENTSSFDEWVKMGAPENVNNSDIQYIKQSSMPQKKYKIKQAVGYKLPLSQLLEPHEICLIEISKIN